MKDRALATRHRGPSLVAASAVCSLLSACGGSSGGGSRIPVDPPPVDSPAYAYIASADIQGRQVPGAVYQYAFAPDGSPTPMGVASVPSGIDPVAIISDPTGHYVYVANLGEDTISQYLVSAGGELMPLSPATVSLTGESPVLMPLATVFWLTVDPQSRSLYAVTSDRPPATPWTRITQYSIGSDGTLTPLALAVIDVSASASAPLAIDPSGRYAYLAGNSGVSGQVAQFSIANDGALLPLTPATALAAPEVIGVALAPSGQMAYVLSTCVDSSCDGQVAPYTIASDGTLSPTGTSLLTGSHVNPISMMINGSGTSAYLLSNLMRVDTNTGAVYQYSIESTGALVPYTPTFLGVSSGSVAESLVGTNLYALSANAIGSAAGTPPGGHVDHYVIGSTGALTSISTADVAASLPTAMTIVVTH
jgi:6-phosphogluconolactonase (cycloisomerase 2 family)